MLDFLKILKVIEENRLDVFTTSSLARLLAVPPSGIQNYLETLSNNELIKRIEKGKYCRIYLDDKFIIGSKIVEGGVVSHQSALAYHGLGEDIPGEVYVSSTQQKQSKVVFGNRISFIRIRPHKEFGAREEHGPNGSFRVSDLEKTILDCLDLPKYLSSYKGLLDMLPSIPLDFHKLTEYGWRMKNLSVLKRIAYIIDSRAPGKYEDFLSKVRKHLNDRYTLLDPGGPDQGEFCARWRIRNNLLTEPTKA